MSGNTRGGARILGSLRSSDDHGVVRMTDRFDTDIDDLWSALTDPRRLGRWLGEHAIEATLTAGGGQTILVIEERGMPFDQLAAYGAGVQVHVEDLAAHLVDHDRCDGQARWVELLRAYQDLATTVS